MCVPVLYLADVGVLDGPGPVDAVVDGGLVGEPGAGAVPGGPEPRAAAPEGGEGRRWILEAGDEARVRASPVVIRCMLKKEDTRSRTLNDSSNSSDTDPFSGVTLNKKIVSSSQSLYSLATVGS